MSTTKQRQQGRNGKPESTASAPVLLEIAPAEAQLLYAMLEQTNFRTAVAKQLAASLQTKIETLFPQE